MKKVFILLFASIIISGPAAAQKVYKCQDEEGNWVFSEVVDQLPENCKDQIHKEIQKEIDQKEAKKKQAKEAEMAAKKILLPSKKEKQPETPTTPCADLGAKLEKCEFYECSFTTPAGKQINRAVMGKTVDSCRYEEDMSEKLVLRCLFKEKELKAAAEYYKVVVNAKTVEAKTIKDKKTGVSRTVDFVDGKEMENPLAAGINAEICQPYPKGK